MASLLLASNRGPVSYHREPDGSLRAHRGGGGLVSALSGVSAEVTWVCAALSEEDRAAVRATPGRLPDSPGTRMLDIEPDTFARAYNRVANETLWFVSHLLYDLPSSPRFGPEFAADWQAYRSYNRAFADALAQEAPPEAHVLVQDYHLALVPALLRRDRPDLALAHFSHTPWAPPEYLAVLPDQVAVELLEGMLGADHLGFLTQRWADAFARCAEERAGATRFRGVLSVGGREVHLGVHPLGVDAAALRERAGAADVEERLAALRELAGGRRLVVRIDRTELSKNILRGIAAYADLLRRHPRWRGQVTHLVLAYPSRGDLPAYRAYTQAVQAAAAAVNEEFAQPGWTPLHLEVADDYPRSLAAMRLADVLLVNPVRDGMNLVAKEGPVLSDAGCALVLSREAGAAAELAEAAFVVNPFDVTATADALDAALAQDPGERRRRCDRLAELAAAWPPGRWLADQVGALTAQTRPAHG